MANKNLAEMVFILDRSGSMCGLEDDTIGGYNGLIEKQIKEKGEAVVTTVLFDDKYEMLYDRADIKKVEKMTKREYYARGMTALLDAVGKTITHVEHRHRYAPDNELPENTTVVIITDGQENASSEYNQMQIKQMIESQKEKYGWEFLFLGANIDAENTAKTYGISEDRAVTYMADSVGVSTNFGAVSRTIAGIRRSKAVTADWKNEIEEYMQKKGRHKK